MPEPIYQTMVKHRRAIEGPCLEDLEKSLGNTIANAIALFGNMMDFEIGRTKVNMFEGATLKKVRRKIVKAVAKQLKTNNDAMHAFQIMLDEVKEEVARLKARANKQE